MPSPSPPVEGCECASACGRIFSGGVSGSYRGRPYSCPASAQQPDRCDDCFRTSGTQTAASAASPPRRLLFVGDSLTYVNNLDKRVAALARTAGVGVGEDGGICELVVEREVKGGAPLKDLWQKTKARQIIAEGGPKTKPKRSRRPWDVVVVQEDLPETDLELFHAFADTFHGAVSDSGAQTVLLSCWEYTRLDWITTEGIAAAHDSAAARTGARVAHAGRAWLRAKEARPELELYAKDREHPSPAGTVLAAAVVFSVLWGLPAPIYGTGANALPQEWGLESADVAFLHRIAWDVVSPSTPEPAAAAGGASMPCSE